MNYYDSLHNRPLATEVLICADVCRRPGSVSTNARIGRGVHGILARTSLSDRFRRQTVATVAVRTQWDAGVMRQR